MKECRDLKFGNHTSMSSENIIFLTHKHYYEAAELLKNRIKKMEEKIKELKGKKVSLLKTANTE